MRPKPRANTVIAYSRVILVKTKIWQKTAIAAKMLVETVTKPAISQWQQKQ